MTNIIIQQTIPVLFKKILQGKISGELLIKGGDFEKKLYFIEGSLVFAASTFPGDRLGHILYHMGKINKDQLGKIAVILKNKKQHEKLGKLLVQHNMLTRKDVFEGLHEQVVTIAVSLFKLTSGEWDFIAKVPDIPVESQFNIKLPFIICKGIKSLERIPFFANEFHYKAPKTGIIPQTMSKYLSEGDIKFFKALSTFHHIPVDKIIKKLKMPEERFWKKINLFYILNILDFDEISGTLEDTAANIDKDMRAIIADLNQFYDAVRGDSCDYYQVLGVNQNASTQEIKKAYAALRVKYHPGSIRVNAELYEKARFVSGELKKAFELLSSKEKRKDYQRQLDGGSTTAEENSQQLVFDQPGIIAPTSPIHQPSPRQILFSSPLQNPLSIPEPVPQPTPGSPGSPEIAELSPTIAEYPADSEPAEQTAVDLRAGPAPSFPQYHEQENPAQSASTPGTPGVLQVAPSQASSPPAPFAPFAPESLEANDIMELGEPLKPQTTSEIAEPIETPGTPGIPETHETPELLEITDANGILELQGPLAAPGAAEPPGTGEANDIFELAEPMQPQETAEAMEIPEAPQMFPEEIAEPVPEPEPELEVSYPQRYEMELDMQSPAAMEQNVEFDDDEAGAALAAEIASFEELEMDTGPIPSGSASLESLENRENPEIPGIEEETGEPLVEQVPEVAEVAEEPEALGDLGEPAERPEPGETGEAELSGDDEESHDSMFGSLDDLISDSESNSHSLPKRPLTDEEKQSIAREKFEKAESLYKRKKYMEAALIIEDALQLGSREFSFVLLLGLAQMEIPLLRKKGEINLLEAAALEPQNAEPLYALGLLYQSEDMPKKAEVFFRKALEINVEHTLAQQMLKKIEETDKEKEKDLSKRKSFFSIFGKK